LVNHQIGNIKNKTWFCERCFNHFSSEMILKQHLLDCEKLNDTKIVFPETERIMEFKGFKNNIKVPFVIYAYLESILVKYNKSGDRGGVDVNKKMHKYQKHEPFSIAYYLKCSYDDTLSKCNLYTGKDCQNWFVQDLKAIALELDKIFKKKIDLKPLNLTQENDFNSATTCYICEKLFAGDKVKEHCHLTGEYEYRGAAHNSCNLNYEDSHMVPVIFHNLSGYDSHFIIKALSTEILGKINLLTINKEKYISFSKYVAGAKINFRFLDSYRFMAESIEKLSSFLPNEKKKKVLLKFLF
jgi:hypothetical protein